MARMVLKECLLKSPVKVIGAYVVKSHARVLAANVAASVKLDGCVARSFDLLGLELFTFIKHVNRLDAPCSSLTTLQ
jgi:hypothetical protein